MEPAAWRTERASTTPSLVSIAPRSARSSLSRLRLLATLLSSEKVLIAGGAQTTSAELYNPTAGTFTATGSMVAERLTGHTATLLSGGKVLIVGGFGVDLSMLASAELYDE